MRQIYSDDFIHLLFGNLKCFYILDSFPRRLSEPVQNEILYGLHYKLEPILYELEKRQMKQVDNLTVILMLYKQFSRQVGYDFVDVLKIQECYTIMCAIRDNDNYS